METIIRPVRELRDVERSAMEHLVGHSLRENQQLVIQVMPLDVPSAASAIDTPPPDANRQAAWLTINRILDTAAQNMKDVPVEEFDAALEEAMEQVRPRRHS